MAATMTQTQLDHPPHLNLKPTTSKPPPSTHSATRIIYIGLLANLSLALIKYTFGHILSSKSLIADAWHSFSDLSTDFSALFALFLTSFLHKRDVDGKLVERHVSVLASGILMATAVHVGWESVESLMVNGPWSGNTMKHEHLYEAAAPSVQAIWPALLTIVVKEWLYREFMKVADATKSVVLASTAVHQRADSLISVVAVITILAGTVFETTGWIDSVGGLFISALIIKSALGNLGKAIGIFA